MPGKICLMYSYKGGAGRTVATANLASILAKELGKKVVCIDLDLEGAGLSVVFDIQKYLAEKKCLQDIFNEGVLFRDQDEFVREWWNKMSFDIGEVKRDESLKKRLFLIPARFGASDAIECSEDIERGFRQFLRLVQNVIKPDIILLDSSSGFQDWSTLGMAVSDLLVIFFRWNNQAVEGTIETVKFILARENSATKLLLVPSAVPRISLEIPKYKRILDSSHRRLMIETKINESNNVKLFSEGIGEAVGLKWEEKILNLKTDNEDDEKITLEDYRNISKLILENLQ